MSNYKKAILALIVANIIWGMGPPIFKWSFQNISPLTLAFARFVIPVIVMLPFITKLQRIRIRDTFYFILLGLFNCTLNIGLYFLGLQYTASINQPIIASSGPIWVIVFSVIFLRDKVTKRILFGNIVGLTGILFIFLQPLFYNHQYSSFLGNALFVISTLSGALGTITGKKLAKRYNAFTLTFWTFFIATLSFLPVAMDEISHHTFISSISWQGIIGIAFGGILSSLVGYSLIYYGLKHIKASETTIFTYVDPVAALLIAAPLLHEFPNPDFIFGSILIFLGIYIAEGRLHWHPLHKLLQ